MEAKENSSKKLSTMDSSSSSSEAVSTIIDDSLLLSNIFSDSDSFENILTDLTEFAENIISQTSKSNTDNNKNNPGNNNNLDASQSLTLQQQSSSQGVEDDLDVSDLSGFPSIAPNVLENYFINASGDNDNVPASSSCADLLQSSLPSSSFSPTSTCPSNPVKCNSILDLPSHSHLPHQLFMDNFVTSTTSPVRPFTSSENESSLGFSPFSSETVPVVPQPPGSSNNKGNRGRPKKERKTIGKQMYEDSPPKRKKKKKNSHSSSDRSRSRSHSCSNKRKSPKCHANQPLHKTNNVISNKKNGPAPVILTLPDSKRIKSDWFRFSVFAPKNSYSPSSREQCMELETQNLGSRYFEKEMADNNNDSETISMKRNRYPELFGQRIDEFYYDEQSRHETQNENLCHSNQRKSETAPSSSVIDDDVEIAQTPTSSNSRSSSTLHQKVVTENKLKVVLVEYDISDDDDEEMNEDQDVFVNTTNTQHESDVCNNSNISTSCEENKVSSPVSNNSDIEEIVFFPIAPLHSKTKLVQEFDNKFDNCTTGIAVKEINPDSDSSSSGGISNDRTNNTCQLIISCTKSLPQRLEDTCEDLDDDDCTILSNPSPKKDNNVLDVIDLSSDSSCFEEESDDDTNNNDIIECLLEICNQRSSVKKR